MKVAIVHYWLIGMRGGEKVVESLCRIFPDADIFTHVYDPEAVSAQIRAHRVSTTFIGRLPLSRRLYKRYLPLMPLALEELDLSGYDLVISSESGPAKGVIPAPGALHICYCHSPMRYIWNMYHEYRGRSGLATRLSMPLLSHYVRTWDALSASRVDHFVANSANVAQRIERYYRRPSTVIHPPVAVDDFAVAPPSEIGDYHLMVGELVAYKRTDLAIEAFNRMGRRLVVIGGGESLAEARRMAGPTVEIMGPQPFEVLRDKYARCQALVFPGDEDFGIVPVEAMASGRPVIAFGRGGATESVVGGKTGVFFKEQTVEAIVDAVQRCDATKFKPEIIQDNAQRFSTSRFEIDFTNFVKEKLAERRARSYAADDSDARSCGIFHE